MNLLSSVGSGEKCEVAEVCSLWISASPRPFLRWRNILESLCRTETCVKNSNKLKIHTHKIEQWVLFLRKISLQSIKDLFKLNQISWNSHGKWNQDFFKESVFSVLLGMMSCSITRIFWKLTNTGFQQLFYQILKGNNLYSMFFSYHSPASCQSGKALLSLWVMSDARIFQNTKWAEDLCGWTHVT